MVGRDVPIQDAPHEPVPFKYSITSYGSDFDVEGLIRRIERQDIYVPTFQRRFVWSLSQASRFVESLLLGLPVPGIFLSRDGESKLLVIDGQQRLRSLLYFYNGVFEPTGRKFALTHVHPRFNGLTYRELDSEDKRRLNDSIIHATVIRQDYPDDGNSSIYFVFARLNTGATLLQPQEIRVALYHGPFDGLLNQLNENDDWRLLFGRVHSRRRDLELILRFLALYFSGEHYQKPMVLFLNDFMGGNRYLERYPADEISKLFERTVSLINRHIGNKAFKPRGALNAAILDSVMVGVARNLSQGQVDSGRLLEQYRRLLADESYQHATETATTDEENVQRRLHLATTAFKDAQ
jgi:hypothetical protein